MVRVSKRYEEDISVEVRGFEPVAFEWRGRKYEVTSLLKRWRESSSAWDPENAKDLECFRVEASGGIYDLRFDRIALKGRQKWRLARVWD